MEKRKKDISILLTLGGKIVSIELTDALKWPDVYGVAEGLYRVKINGRWHNPNGKYSFLTRFAVARLLERLLSGEDCAADSAKLPTNLKKSTRVSVPTTYHDGAPLTYEGGYPCAPPHSGPDGRAWLWCRCASGDYLAPVQDIVIQKRKS